jgi:hypothetical protein
LSTIEVLKAKLKSREKMERSNSIFKDKLKDNEDRWLKLLTDNTFITSHAQNKTNILQV